MRFITKAIIVIAFSFSASWAYSEKAVFAGGCFWCVEAAFQDLVGVTAAVSGFTGGSLKNPTYRGNHKGHYEAVEVSYDPTRISYQQLLDVFWVNIDPFDPNGQFCDKGFSYLSAIFVANEEQRQLADASRSKVIKQFSANKVVTPILDSAEFWPVEKSHQDYYTKNPLRYKYYRYGCGRDQRLKTIWGDAAKH
ncbi:MAG: peptide-methionine (S)-S-oxide reductase [Oceanicoccus sp.]|jgi:peptide-methionine (S)-S-oxide reductase